MKAPLSRNADRIGVIASDPRRYPALVREPAPCWPALAPREEVPMRVAVVE
jgi:hypothetical protein